MNRLTKKGETAYMPTERGAQFLEVDDGSNAARLLQVIGSYEDLMEKYGIKDTKDLDERLGIYQSLADHDYTAMDKPAYEAMMSDILEYREAEKESGISLITIHKALRDGIWLLPLGGKIPFFVRYPYFVWTKGNGKDILIVEYGRTPYEAIKYGMYEYGTKWALTKEELL